MPNNDFGPLANRFSPSAWPDQEVVPLAAIVLVWGRWLCWTIGLSGLVSSPPDWYPAGAGYIVLYTAFITLNGLVHFRLLARRPVTWRWMLALNAMDIVLITAHAMHAGLDGLIFLAYYPALGAFALVFPSIGIGMIWTTLTAVAYVCATAMVGTGLDIDAGDQKVLLSRLWTMYVMVLGISLIIRFERQGRQTATTRERQLQQERVQVSQAIHDTTAQTAYMIGLGIHRARALADESNEELMAALEETAALSKSAMWELRHPIDSGHIFEGRELARVLRSHCASFERIAGVPAEVLQAGTEPQLPTGTKTRLFSIAHNALTNALLHARPSRVVVSLEFEFSQFSLSVSDDGVGLPDDYAERGRGLPGMRADAEAMGGILVVESGDGRVGTTIICVVPREVWY